MSCEDSSGLDAWQNMAERCDWLWCKGVVITNALIVPDLPRMESKGLRGIEGVNPAVLCASKGREPSVENSNLQRL